MGETMTEKRINGNDSVNHANFNHSPSVSTLPSLGLESYNTRKEGYGRIVPPKELLACKGCKVVLDVETTGLYPWPGHDRLIGVGFYCPENIHGHEQYGYIPTAKYRKVTPSRGKDFIRAIPDRGLIDETLEIVHEVVRSPGTILFGHNLKFDAHFLGIDLWRMDNPYVDTTVLVHLFDTRLPKSMARAEKQFLGSSSKREHNEEATEGIPKRKKKDFTRWPLDAIADYCVNDCMVTYQLAMAIKPKIQDLDMSRLFNKEMVYLGCLQQIEQAGIRINYEYCNRSIRELNRVLQGMERELCNAVSRDPDEFNWRSYQQLSPTIWEGMGIPKPKNPFVRADGTPNDNHPLGKKYNDWCTAQDVLDHEDHPLAGLIADIRETYKLMRTVEKWINLADENGVIHSSFNITGTRTGRLSSSKPNLQNVAAKERHRVSERDDGSTRSDAYNLRQAFVCRDGYRMVSIDHSQQEIRLLALMTQDERLLQALVDREDMHGVVAEQIWGEEEDFKENFKYYRGLAKNIHFAILYGLSIGAMAYRTDMEYVECERIMNDYFRTFHAVKPWQNKIERDIIKRGYTRYWSGRIWRESDESKAYKAVNAQIQGGSADLMSIAVIRIVELLNRTGWGHVISIIHDEVLIEIREECLEEAIGPLLECMEVEDLFGFPFAADCAVGSSYGDLDDEWEEDDDYAEGPEGDEEDEERRDLEYA